jgi:YgiT-type zinc finger domain-containing protein
MKKTTSGIKLSSCPICGSKDFREVVEDVFFPAGGKNYKVPALKHYRCFNCGERIFDLEAGEKIDQYCLKKKLRRAG